MTVRMLYLMLARLAGWMAPPARSSAPDHLDPHADELALPLGVAAGRHLPVRP